MHCVALRVVCFKQCPTSQTQLHYNKLLPLPRLLTLPSLSLYLYVSLAAHVHCGAAMHRLSACPICAVCQSKLVLGHGENVSTGKGQTHREALGEVHIILVSLVSKAQASSSSTLDSTVTNDTLCFCISVCATCDLRHAAWGSTATLR